MEVLDVRYALERYLTLVGKVLLSECAWSGVLLLPPSHLMTSGYTMAALQVERCSLCFTAPNKVWFGYSPDDVTQPDNGAPTTAK